MEKLPTGIPGFDTIAAGGLPLNRTTLVAGTAGSAKTVFAAQFLVHGILSEGEPGVFVTFEESAEDIRRNLISFGWNIAEWEAAGHWAFVDASPSPEDDVVEVGAYDLGALLSRIRYAIERIGAKRLSMDSLGAIFSQLTQTNILRRELFRIARAVKDMGVTSIMTAEREQEYGAIARMGIEEFVADNVIILRNALLQERRHRTVEILKFRGTYHQKGEFSFTIIPRQGIVVIPMSDVELKQRSSHVRITSGNDKLDDMCSGGFFRDSIILVSGATGTGKTLMTTIFAAGGVAEGERCMLFAFEESREQLFRNATGWGIDYEEMERQGLLQVIPEYPEVRSLEDHFVNIRSAIEEFKPNRVAIDSLSALERVSTVRGFREFVLGITAFIKQQEIAGIFTATTPTLLGGTSVTESHISTITDTIILLRYVELYGEIRRGLTVLKMRGSMHDKNIREFAIDGQGLHVLEPFKDVGGILSGHLSHMFANEIDRLDDLFDD